MEPGGSRETKPMSRLRGGGHNRGQGDLRTTATPRLSDSSSPEVDDQLFDLEQALANATITRDQQARILSGSALFGVIAIVLLHELGHWIAGFTVTGVVPDYLFVAVRQSVTEFSRAGGILTWGAGPLAHIVVLWAIVLFVTGKGRKFPRLFAIAGGAAFFSVVVQLLIWASATFTSPNDWGNDLPRVATFLGSWAQFWMHLLSAVFTLATLGAAYWWWLSAKATGSPRLFVTPAIVGAIQGGVLVVIATFVVSLSQ